MARSTPGSWPPPHGGARSAHPRRRRGQMREDLPRVADHVVAAIIEEVPSYTDAFSGPMGETIRNAVQLALGGFLSLASGRRGARPAHPGGTGGRGCLPARPRRGPQRPQHRRPARGVPDRRPGLLARHVAHRGPATASTARCWSTSPSWSSPTSTSCRPRAWPATPTRPRRRGGCGSGCSRASASCCSPRAPRGGPRGRGARPAGRRRRRSPRSWCPRRRCGRCSAGRRPGTISAARSRRSEDGRAAPACRTCTGGGGRRCCGRWATAAPLAGPTVPWLRRARSYDRARAGPRPRHRGRHRGPAAPAGAARRRGRTRGPACAALAPLSGLRPASAEKLADTLRAWLLLQGRRDDVAAALFVHPQTVRYRMSQLRELYGDRLDDPDAVLELVLALG